MFKTQEDVKKAFHPIPSKELTEEMKARITRIEYAMVELATEVLDLVPESADRSAALRKILEAKFTCVQAITHVAPIEPVKKDLKNATQKNQTSQAQSKN